MPAHKPPSDDPSSEVDRRGKQTGLRPGYTDAARLGFERYQARRKGKRVGPLAVLCRERRVPLYVIAAASGVPLKTCERIAKLRNVETIQLGQLVRVAWVLGVTPADLVPGLARPVDASYDSRRSKKSAAQRRDLARSVITDSPTPEGVDLSTELRPLDAIEAALVLESQEPEDST